MYDDRYDDGIEAWMLALFIGLCIFVAGFSAYCIATSPTTTETFEIWEAECPFGHYYTDTSGSGCFLCFYMDSSLGEGYVIKFFDNDILKTLIVDAVNDDVRVHLTNNTERMWMTLEFEGHTLETMDEHYDSGGTDWFWIDIYVPDPKLVTV